MGLVGQEGKSPSAPSHAITHPHAQKRTNQQYLDQLKEPLIVMLLCSALVSALMRQYDDALSIAAAVLIVSTVAFIQVRALLKSTNQMTASIHCPPAHTYGGGFRKGKRKTHHGTPLHHHPNNLRSTAPSGPSRP